MADAPLVAPGTTPSTATTFTADGTGASADTRTSTANGTSAVPPSPGNATAYGSSTVGQWQDVGRATTTEASDASLYPVSVDGACPYCHSTHVQYLVLHTAGNALSPVLTALLKTGHAARVAETHTASQPEPPSFKCFSCGYGFNLDFTKTNLETIFHEPLAKARMASKETFVNWQRDVTQWRAHQAYWGNETLVESTEDPAQAALDAVRQVIEAAKAGKSVDHASLVPATMAPPPESLRPGAARAEGYVTSFEDYNVAGNFNQMSGRFAATSSDDYWAKKGLSNSSDMRGLSNFMDTAQLEGSNNRSSGSSQKVGYDGRFQGSGGDGKKKRHKPSAKEVRAFKQAKKKRQHDKANAYLRTDRHNK